MQRGDLVIVEMAKGRRENRRVWGVSGDLVYCCTENQYHLKFSGQDSLPAIGFPKEDVRLEQKAEPEPA